MLHVLWLLSTPTCTHNMNIYIYMIWIIYWLNFNNAQPWNKDIIGESPEIVVIISDDSSWCGSTSPEEGPISRAPGHKLPNVDITCVTWSCLLDIPGEETNNSLLIDAPKTLPETWVGFALQNFFGNMSGTSCWWRSQRNRQVRIMPNVGWTRKKT